jgi:hypothetical protein
MGKTAELRGDLTWSGAVLRAHAADALDFAVHTLKYRRREIADDAILEDLGVENGCCIFVNSSNLTSSACLAKPVPLERAPPRVSGFTDEVISRRVVQLQELGFPREDCERALRAAQFNTDRAVDYLLSGAAIPEPLVIQSVASATLWKAPVALPVTASYGRDLVTVF